jgi:Putative Flp pilus-assembly TadE/G-like
MERSNNPKCSFLREKVSNRANRAARNGKITLVTIFAILGLIVMAGFVGNAGHVVTTKIATQNAADSIAFSSAQWMARGMNAVTATNHLLGEATGLVVVIEALGGPEADQNMEDYPAQPKTLDQVNRTLVNTAPIQGLPVYGVQALNPLDKQFVDFIVNKLVSPDGDRAKFRAFATIYDSKFVLKKDTTEYLIAKSVANIGLFVPPPWGYISAAVAYGVHIYANVKLAKIGVEYVILEGLQILAVNPVVKNLKVTILEGQLIPALAAHGDFVAGRVGKAAKQKPQAGSGIVNGAVADSLKHLSEVYHVDAAIFPGATTFRLPLEPEPSPSLRGTQKDEPEWGSDELVTVKAEDVLGDFQDDINDNKKKISNRIKALQAGVQLLDKLEANIDKQLAKGNELSADERQKFLKEKQEIARSRTEKQQRIADLTKQLQELNQKQSDINSAVANLRQPMAPGSGNISAKPAHLARDKMRQSEERYTQWVRATYPYVDSFRAPILSQFDNLLSESKAADHFRKWTDRYTLTKAWQFRSGFRFQRDSDNSGHWAKDSKAEPLQMYVMTGAFAKAGERRDQKGNESWTLASDAGKQQAEQLFTVIGITQRDLKPLFSPVIYPLATDDGITTFAQAIYYNSNEQKPEPIGSKSKTQAKLGWDTLNWDPKTATPEWGAEPFKSSAKWPWEIFDSSTTFVGTAHVRLNWQAKLMPVTESRFDQAAKASLVNPKMTANMVKARLFFKQMVTH